MKKKRNENRKKVIIFTRMFFFMSFYRMMIIITKKEKFRKINARWWWWFISKQKKNMAKNHLPYINCPIYLSIHLLNYIQPMPYDLSPLCCCCCFILIYWMSLTYDQWVCECVCEGALLLLLLIPFSIPINQQTNKRKYANFCFSLSLSVCLINSFHVIAYQTTFAFIQ